MVLYGTAHVAYGLSDKTFITMNNTLFPRKSFGSTITSTLTVLALAIQLFAPLSLARAVDEAPIVETDTTTVVQQTDEVTPPDPLPVQDEVVVNQEESSVPSMAEVPTTATVSATLIVCDNESDLPNWGGTTTSVDANTATDFLAAHPSTCHAASDWNFEWSDDATNPGDNAPAGAAGWNLFDNGPTDVDGIATATIPAGTVAAIRQVGKHHFIDFSGLNTDQDVSAEFVCGAPADPHNYNNRESLGAVASGETYHCIGFNAPIPDEPTPSTANLVATKIVCDVETDLPDWAATTNAITASTATDFLMGHPNCHAASGWNFQWATKDTPSPGDNKQMGAEGWTTFGPTNSSGVATTTIPVASDLTVRTEVRGGFINFSGIDNHHDGVSAEMLCGAPTDIHRYDNREQLGVLVGGSTTYCVSFVAVSAGVAAEPQQCDLVSDTTNDIKGKDMKAVETWVHPAWAKPLWITSAPFAKWIWAGVKVGDPAHDRTVTFVKSFDLSAIPSSATLELAADNGVTVRVNGTVVVDKITEEHNYASTVSYPITNLKVGTNELKITVQNFAMPGGTYDTNPAGLLYWLHIDGSACVAPQVPPVDTTDSTPPSVVTDTGNKSGPMGGFMAHPNTLGEVLGASTDAIDAALAQCGEYLHSYIKRGQDNDKADVIRLQAFLNKYLGTKLVATGIYDYDTFTAVRRFQVKTSSEVLDPWKQTPGGINENGTGYVYKTTRRMINMIQCPALNIQMPELS